MARGFTVRRVTVDGTRALRYAARLDAAERALVAGLMEQVAERIGAPVPSPEADDAPADEFEAIVGRLGIGGADSPEGEAGSRGEIDDRIVDFAAALTPVERNRLATALAEPPAARGRDQERGPRSPL